MNWAILAITALALVVRLVTTTWTGFTADEVNGAAIAGAGGWFDLVEHLKADGNAPLFAMLVKPYVQAVGLDETALKALVVAISTLTVPLAYLLCRRLLGERMAACVATMVALCPPVVRFTTLFRGYSLVPALSLLSMWAFVRLMDNPGKPRWIAVYAAATAALVYCHYFGAFVAAGQAASVLWAFASRRLERARLGSWLAGAALAFLLFLPWLPAVAHQTANVLAPWDGAPWFSNIVITIIPVLLVGIGYTGNPFDHAIIVVSNLLIIVTLLAPRAGFVPASGENPEVADDAAGSRGAPSAVLWKVSVWTGFVGALAFGCLKGVFRDRYLLVFTPLIIVSYIAGCDRLLERAPKMVRAVLPLAVWIPMWLPQYLYMTALPESSTPAVARRIVQQADTGRDLVVISCQCLAPAVNVYLPENVAVVNFPDIDRTLINRWDGMSARLRDPGRMERLLERMQSALDRGGTVWLVEPAHNLRLMSPYDNSVVMAVPFLEADFRRMDQIRTWLTERAAQEGDNFFAPGRDVNVFLSGWRPNGTGQVPEKREASLMGENGAVDSPRSSVPESREGD